MSICRFDIELLHFITSFILDANNHVSDSVGNVFFSYLAILGSCFKIVLAKLELHLPSLHLTLGGIY